MIKGLPQSLKSVLGQKQAIVQKERQLIEDLNRVLREIGYQVVPMGGQGSQSQAAAATGKPAKSGASSAKPFVCKECDRRFARPLHLGRHMAATHPTKTRGA